MDATASTVSSTSPLSGASPRHQSSDPCPPSLVDQGQRSFGVTKPTWWPNNGEQVIRRSAHKEVGVMGFFATCSVEAPNPQLHGSP